MSMRLQKALAQAGVASRRASERLIQEGRVSVNGQVITRMGVQIDPGRDEIVVDGRRVEMVPERQYIKVYKPAGYLSVMRDDRGRRSLGDLVPGVQGVHPVGRLDLYSEGLILLTDDGELTQHLTHPRYEHRKAYDVLVRGAPDATAVRRLREGVDLEDGRSTPAEVTQPLTVPWGAAPRGWSWLHIVLHEGRKRQIRRMCGTVGHPVRRLIRVRIGPIELGDLAVGARCPLTRAELRDLRNAVK
jgi:23S rRNA pseudouridine2605 synthase